MPGRSTVPRQLIALFFGVSVASGAIAGPCDDPAYRAFDFWLGEWQVHTPDGKLAGANRIEREYDGCVVYNGSWLRGRKLKQLRFGAKALASNLG